MKFFCIVFSLLLCSSVSALDLIECPDCEEQVSPRAIMCPHCGCPGQAIAEAAAQVDEKLPESTPGPILRLDTGAKDGFAVAVTIGENRYLIMDAGVLWDAESLTITTIATNSPIAYRDLQLAKDVPLARFRTDATNLTFVGVAKTTTAHEKELFWMMPGNESSEQCLLESAGSDATAFTANARSPVPVAMVDAQTNLVGIAFQITGDEYSHVLPSENEWLDAKPGVFRAQTSLITKAERECNADLLTSETRRQFSSTKWLTEFLRLRADAVVQLSGKD